jgi:hypothetical protein
LNSSLGGLQQALPLPHGQGVDTVSKTCGPAPGRRSLDSFWESKTHGVGVQRVLNPLFRRAVGIGFRQFGVSPRTQAATLGCTW